MFSLPVK